MKILMVSPVNYGPENMDGTKKILFNILKQNSDWNVDFLSFDDSEVDYKLNHVQNYFVNNSTKLNLREILTFPYLLQKYDFNNMSQKLIELLAVNEYDLVVFVTSIMARLIEKVPAIYKKKSILLSVDLLSLFWKRRVDSEKSFKSIAFKFQLGCWENYEKRFFKQFEKVIFVSILDKEYCEKLIGKGKVFAIENGVDTNVFNCNSVYKSKEERFSLIFTGNMLYLPNKTAVKFLISNIYPKIKENIKDVKLYIVGIGAKKLSNLANDKNIIFIDYVENMCEYLLKARIYVSPLMQGSGMKNKILEAMATGRLIVGSQISFDGIKGLEKDDVCIVEKEEDYVEAILQCINYEDEKITKIQKNLCELIKNRYSWDYVAQRYDKIFIEVINR